MRGLLPTRLYGEMLKILRESRDDLKMGKGMNNQCGSFTRTGDTSFHR